jgi:hypothetical protein
VLAAPAVDKARSTLPREGSRNGSGVGISYRPLRRHTAVDAKHAAGYARPATDGLSCQKPRHLSIPPHAHPLSQWRDTEPRCCDTQNSGDHAGATSDTHRDGRPLDPVTWATESYLIVERQGYRGVVAGALLGAEYADANREAVQRRIVQAGYRLGLLLNRLLDA